MWDSYARFVSFESFNGKLGTGEKHRALNDPEGTVQADFYKTSASIIFDGIGCTAFCVLWIKHNRCVHHRVLDSGMCTVAYCT